jgi:hypothetical protein
LPIGHPRWFAEWEDTPFNLLVSPRHASFSYPYLLQQIFLEDPSVVTPSSGPTKP